MENNQGTIFINGKQQVIDMLQFMTEEERMVLVKNIYNRNPQLANELFEKSLKFESIASLTNDDLQRLLGYTNAQVMGVALKGVPQNLQRRVLSLAQRSYAEEAFKVMNSTLRNEARDVTRAQDRIVSTLISLSKKKVIKLQ
ncbi:FliG C-terminal domain-containing protein [Halobacteriovorax sp. GB3]|uniref:FliG C-terminal domain-containing protein n=1 Tax=Halobacteriovorax sp. GB3 TaxID=2719615 RepID=UPI002360EE56|nr:FliG C-terminal domain-containing protein [Halobacteriovorax sp. GB3]MDD0854536.1 FliG C-terminal domain-containing protein [Halobacteriovorax sp. GB3]